MAMTPTRSEFVQSVPPDPSAMIDLKLGYPCLATLPRQDIIDSSKAFPSTMTDPYFYMYGINIGYKSCREAIANCLAKKYKQPVNGDHIMITNGASGGLDLICKRLTSPGDVVLTEDPTYFLVKNIFHDFHLSVHSVPMNFRQTPVAGTVAADAPPVKQGDAKPPGVDVEELERLVKLHQPKLFYTVPIGHNPTGVTTSMEVRKKVIELARTYGFKVVADEVYQLLTFSDEVPPPYAMCQPVEELEAELENTTVISVNSFSKVLAPALRTGWIQSSRAVVQHLGQTGMILSGGGLSPFVSGLIHWIVNEDRLLPAADRTRHDLSAKAINMMNAMTKFFPSDVVWYPPGAGYFVVVELPEWLPALELLEACRKRKVNFLPGAEFGGERCHNLIRLSFSFYEMKDVEKAIQEIGGAIHNLRASKT